MRKLLEYLFRDFRKLVTCSIEIILLHPVAVYPDFYWLINGPAVFSDDPF